MDIPSLVRENIVRFLALVCLVVGLGDASRLLGVHTGNANPIILMGGGVFVSLAIFTLARLFAAVGLWINASWGGAILIGATLAELVLLASPGFGYVIPLFDLLVRLALLVSISGLLANRLYKYYRHIHD